MTSKNVTNRRKAWSASEIAIAYGFSLGFVRKLIYSGTLAAKKVGRRVIVLDDDFQRFLAECSVDQESQK